MQNLNSLSTFGTHPKDFDPRQVKPVLLDLATVLEWYMRYLVAQKTVVTESDILQPKRKEPVAFIKTMPKPGKRIIMAASILLAGAIIIVSLVLFNLIGGGKKTLTKSIKSLVVLPFSNYTGDAGLGTLISGMQSCLIADIQRLSGLRVICKTSSNAYKDTDKPVHEIASELNVDAAIEVSVLGYIDSLVIQVSLINAFPEEEIVWMSDYKEEKSQILNLYNRITKQIADEVKIELTPGEKSILAESRTVDPEALVAYMKGQFFWERLGTEDLDSAMHYFQIAIDKEPDWGAPYAGMAMSWSVRGVFREAPPDDFSGKKIAYLNKAFELDPNSANSHYVKAQIATWTDGDWQKGEKEFLKTLELNPSDALCRIYYAHLLMILRRSDEAVRQANLALALDPLRPLVLVLYSVVMNYAGEHQSALTQAEKALSIDPQNDLAINVLANSYIATGDTLKWFEVWKRKLWWSNKEVSASLDKIFQERGFLAVIEDRIKVNEDVYTKGGSISYTGQAARYLIMKNYDKAMDYYEKAFDQRRGSLAYISLAVINYPELKDNPRYIALVKKMNLPLK
jgi:TolB-like protein/tetratricopeptide (TPR) repeat protein